MLGEFRIKGSCEFINIQPKLRADQISDERNITSEMSIHKLRKILRTNYPNECGSRH